MAAIEPKPSEGYAPLLQDGQAGLDARRQRRRYTLLGCFIIYGLSGMLLFYLAEGWNFLQTTLFTLSILTGVGYGHIAPGTDAGKLLTALWIIAGVSLFASIAGQILDVIMHWEIDAVLSSFQKVEESESLHEMRNAERRTSFFAGLANASLAFAAAIILFMARYGDSFSTSLYNASVSVLNLDNVCTVDGVKCSPGWQSDGMGRVGDMILAICWLMVAFAVMGHFTVSFASYIGADGDPVLSRIADLSEDRFYRMDVDHDGQVKRSEFLRDRLIQGGFCDAADIDRILKNFDDLDKSGTGTIDIKDVM